jgi:hypothetical protein
VDEDFDAAGCERKQTMLDTREVDLGIAKAALDRAEEKVIEARDALAKAIDACATPEAEALAAFEKAPTDANWAKVAAAREPRERAEVVLRAAEREAEELRATFETEHRAVLEMKLADARRRGSVEAFFAAIRADLITILEADRAILGAIRRIFAAVQGQHAAAREIEELSAADGQRVTAPRVQTQRLPFYIGRALFEGRQDVETRAWLRETGIDLAAVLKPQTPSQDSPGEAEFFATLREPVPTQRDVATAPRPAPRRFLARSSLGLSNAFGERRDVAAGHEFLATPDEIAGLQLGRDYDVADARGEVP